MARRCARSNAKQRTAGLLGLEPEKDTGVGMAVGEHTEKKLFGQAEQEQGRAMQARHDLLRVWIDNLDRRLFGSAAVSARLMHSGGAPGPRSSRDGGAGSGVGGGAGADSQPSGCAVT